MRLEITFQQTYVEIKLAQIELVLAFDDLNPCASATKWKIVLHGIPFCNGAWQ
jgi:dolichyl-phosphate-mannose--protein O-mannosyl transferase